MVGKLGGFARDEFENILVERRVVESLNRLEDVIAEAKRRKARAPEGEDAPVA
jgi:kinetochore protein NNF1